VRRASFQKVCIVALSASSPPCLIYQLVSLDDDDEESVCSVELP
jgi:hypothetical protein